MPACFRVCRTLERISGCLLEICNGFARRPPLFEVHRKLSSDGGRMLPISSFQPIANRTVEPSPLFRRRACIHHFLVLGVSEAITGRQCAVRPRDRGVGQDESAFTRPGGETRFDPLFSQGGGSGDRGDRERISSHARRRENLLILTGQLLESPFEKLTYSGWYDIGQLVWITARRVWPAQQLIHDGCKKERVASSSAAERLRELKQRGNAADALLQVVLHSRQGEIVEHHFAALWVLPKLGDQTSQRVIVKQGFNRPVRAQDEQPPCITPSGSVRKPFQCRGIAPVEIFQDEN